MGQITPTAREMQGRWGSRTQPGSQLLADEGGKAYHAEVTRPQAKRKLGDLQITGSHLAGVTELSELLNDRA